MAKKNDQVIGYKGFDNDLKCRDFQYEVGKEYDHEGEVKLCKNGFHFCEYPLAVFDFYAPSNSRFARVEGRNVSDETESDTKRVAQHIKIETELSISSLVEAAVKFTFERASWLKKKSATGYQGAASATGTRGAASATGYQGAASATGYQGAASATGTQGAASATGYQGAASATGYQGAASATGTQGAASATGTQGAASATGTQGAASATGTQGAASATGVESCAVALGIEGKAKGKIGCWITIAEWKRSDDETTLWHRVDVQTKQVDGKKIKEDTYYQLKNGNFVEAE